MNKEPKFVIVGKGQDPSGHIGHTEAEHLALFAAVDRGDIATIEALVGVTVTPTAKLDVDGIYRRFNTARAPAAIDAAGINAARKARRAAAKAEPLANIHARMARHAMFPTRKAAKL